MRETHCRIHYIRAKKRDYIIIVELEEQKRPTAIFADIKRDRNLLNAQHGTLHYTKAGAALTCDNGIVIDNLMTDFNGTSGLVCKLVSLSLASKDVTLSQIISMLKQSHALGGLETALVRILRYYESLQEDSQ